MVQVAPVAAMAANPAEALIQIGVYAGEACPAVPVGAVPSSCQNAHWPEALFVP